MTNPLKSANKSVSSVKNERMVLIIDDNPTNLGVIADYLEDYGFTILVARDGESGLEKAQYAQPDIILLDVMMPGIDGFETCCRLKENDLTNNIPVIFMTALTEAEHKVKAFEAGAVDYVTKPLHQEEVLARVNTHLKIQELTDNLLTANQQLTQMNADKDKFLSIVAHDLKGPFLPLLGNAQLLAEMATQLDPNEVQQMSQTIHRSAERVMHLLENLLQWARLQMGRMPFHPNTLDLTHIIERNITLFREMATKKDIRLRNRLQQSLFVYADNYMLDTIIRNLISNALKFTPHDGIITINARVIQTEEGQTLPSQSTDSWVEITISDTGVGIKPDNLDKLFSIGVNFSTKGTDSEQGTGLGLIMCHEMIKRNGGQIWVESQLDKGSTFTFTLPMAEAIPVFKNRNTNLPGSSELPGR